MISNMILGTILLIVGAFWTSYIFDAEISKLYLIGSIGSFIIGLSIIMALRWTIDM